MLSLHRSRSSRAFPASGWSAGVHARSVRDSAPERGALTPSFAIVASIPRRPPGGGGHGGPRSVRQLLRGRRWSAGVPARSVRDSAPERGALTPSFAIVASIPRFRLERGRPCPLGARQRAGARCSHSIVRDRREHSPPALRAAAGTEARAPSDNRFAEAMRASVWSAGVPARSVRDSAPERGALTPSFAIVASIPSPPSGRRRARRPALRQTIASRMMLERGRPCPLGARQRAGARCSHSIVRDRREHSPPPSGRRRARRPALRPRHISRRRRGAAHATARRARRDNHALEEDAGRDARATGGARSAPR